MNIPSNFNVQTKEFVQVFTKFCLYLSKFGTKAMEEYLDSIPIKMGKTDGKHLGAYIINKILEEYEHAETPFSRYELFNSNERRQEISDARIILCVLAQKYLNLKDGEISSMFNKSRHFSKRSHAMFKALDESIPADRKLLAKYKKIDTLVNAYVNFKPKST